MVLIHFSEVLAMINRAALLLCYKQPAINWINESDPDNDASEIDQVQVNEERTVYLIPDKAAASDETVRAWVELNHIALLEHELAGWVADESLWPQGLNLTLFDDWFDVECHSIVLDTSDDAIIEEDEDDESDESVE